MYKWHLENKASEYTWLDRKRVGEKKGGYQGRGREGETHKGGQEEYTIRHKVDEPQDNVMYHMRKSQ